VKKVVLLAPYFLPRRRVGAWRPFKFAAHLRKFGWAPHVITIREKKGSLTDKETEFLSDIPVYELNTPFDFTHKLSRHYELNGHGETIEYNSANGSKSGFKDALNQIDRFFPVDTWLPLFVLLQQKVKKKVLQINPQVLWSTGDPWSSHWLASKVAKSCGLPWVADFRDPWTLSHFHQQRRIALASHIDEIQEKKIIQEASALTFTAHQTEQMYAQKYPGISQKSTTIYNCFDSELFNKPANEKQTFNEDTLNLLFFGKFRPLSPAKPFILMLEQLRDGHPRVVQKIRMYSFGKLCRQDETLARENGLLENFVSLKPIALENTLSILTKADLLWLSTHPARDGIIPAKLWDYLASRRPIVSIAPNPEIKNILQKAGAGIQFDSSNSELVEFLCESVEAKESRRSMPISVSPESDFINQYDAGRTTQKLAVLLDRLA
jgi:hypothetical protein